MFDLDQAITAWRRQMLNAGLESPVPLDELENHLREDIQAQARSGLEAQQAFEVAVQRMGEAKALKSEFEKAGETRRARELKLIRIASDAFACVMACFALYMSTLALFKLQGFSDTNWKEQTLALATVALNVLIAVSPRFTEKCFPVIPDKRTRTKLCNISAALLFGWYCASVLFLLPRFELTISQLGIVVLWIWIIPGSAFFCAFCGLEWAALQSRTTVHS